MAVNSTRKGKGFERQIANKLSTALTPLKFIKTENSGARVGGKNFETLGQLFGADALKLFVGDVVPVNEKEAGVMFRFSVETKFYASPDNFPALVSGSANIFKWFQESVEDAVKTGRTPMLVFKWNNTPIFVATRTTDTNCCPPRLILAQDQKFIDIFYLDDLLKIPSFWYKVI